MYSRVGGFELLIHIENLKPWQKRPDSLDGWSSVKSKCQTGSQVCRKERSIIWLAEAQWTENLNVLESVDSLLVR